MIIAAGDAYDPREALYVPSSTPIVTERRLERAEKTMKKLIRYLKPYTLYAIISPIMMACEVTADLLLPFLTSYIVNYGIMGIPLDDPENGSRMAAWIVRTFCGESATSMQMIITFGLLMLGITLIGGTFGTLCAYTAARASQGFGNDLRCDAYRHVMSLSVEQTDKFTTGSLVTRMTNDVTRLVELVESVLRHFVRAPTFFIGGTIMLLALNVDFGLVLLCSLPVLLIAIIFILKKAIPMFSEMQVRLDNVNSVVQEDVSGARVIKAYVREDYECDRFDRANRALCDTNRRVMSLMAYFSPILNLILNFSIIALFVIGGTRINAGVAGMNAGTIMAGITYVTQVIFSLMQVAMIFQTFSRAAASAERVIAVLDSDPVVLGGRIDDHTPDCPASTPAVELKNVSFSYPGTHGKPVLSGIDLKIDRGETVAVIGATGSGKSSLCKLLMRFYDPTGGEIYIDGRPIKDYSLRALRRKFGFVMQKSVLFSDTIANNIRWGKPDADDGEVKAAAEIAQADGFISDFSDGYDTFVAEKGASLSGGQKQRVSISRALVRHPEILILDDSTSALDLATEARLRSALHSSLSDTTVIMVAQRIASVRDADRIAVIENDGSIRHFAPHDVLMRESETYRDIYDSQMQKNAEDN